MRKNILLGILPKIKPCYLWDISTEADLELIACEMLKIVPNDSLSRTLRVFCVKNSIASEEETVNSLIFYCDITELLTQIKKLHCTLEDLNTPEGNMILFDVSLSVSKPEIIKNRDIIFDYIKQLLLLYEELFNNQTKQSFEVIIPGGDLCFLTGCLLNYPIIYCNQQPNNGNCLSYIDLRSFKIISNSTVIYSFSIPEVFYKEDFYKKFISEWFNSNKKQRSSLKIESFIENYSLILT